MMADSRLRAPATNETPSYLAANVYLGVGLALLIVTSLPETDTLAKYGIGIAVEVTLAALAFLAMRLEGLDLVATARLRRPSLREVGLTVLTLPGLWIAGVLLNLLSSLILGYTTPVTPSQYPRTALEMVALAVTTMVAAPLCEEIMFRGYVQRAYERRTPWLGAVVSGVIFALYHLRFQGAPALLPVAIGLAFIAWRTQSIVPGIVLHAAYNTIATVLMIALSLLPVQITGALTVTVIFLAILLSPVSAAALWLLWRNTSPTPSAQAPQPRRWQRWATVVPTVGLIVVYGYAAVTEVVVGAFPQWLSSGPVQLEAVPAEQTDPTVWRYSVQNGWGQELGEATCTRTIQDEDVALACDADYEGYDLTDTVPDLRVDPNELPRSLQAFTRVLRTDPKTWSLAANWTRDTSELIALEFTETTPAQDDIRIEYRVEAGRPVLSALEHSDGGELAKAGAARMLLPYEWAWRLSAIPFELAYAADATIVQLDQEGKVQLRPGLINVVGSEPTWTPIGTYVTWKVAVTWEDEDGLERQQIAWYDSDSPHTLVGFQDGSVTYSLQASEPPSEGAE